MPPPHDNRQLLEAIRGWTASTYPGFRVSHVVIHIEGLSVPITLANPPGVPQRASFDEPEEDLPFVPGPFQEAILDALDGKALRTDALGAAVGDRGRLYKKGGLTELRDEGLVKHHPRLGFYRPDAPPEQLAGDE